MTIPNLPTDNLYKFRALAGIVIALFATYFLITSTLKNIDSTLELRQNSALLDAQVENMDRKAKALKELIDNSIAEMKGTWKPKPDTLVLRYSDDEIKAMFREINDLAYEGKLTVMKARQSMSRALVEVVEGLVICALWLFVVRLGIQEANAGFSDWRQRVQEPQDSILRLQVEQMSKNGGTDAGAS